MCVGCVAIAVQGILYFLIYLLEFHVFFVTAHFSSRRLDFELESVKLLNFYRLFVMMMMMMMMIENFSACQCVCVCQCMYMCVLSGVYNSLYEGAP